MTAEWKQLPANAAYLWRWLRGEIPPRRAIQEVVRALALIVDYPDLEANFLARVKEIFRPARLVLLQPGTSHRELVASSSEGIDVPLEEICVSRRGRLARWLMLNETCLLPRRQRGVVEHLDPGERELLARLEADILVPMLSLNRLTGILVFGWERPRRFVSSRETELLLAVAAHGGMAFQNAALYARERARLHRLHLAERLAAAGQLAAGIAHEIRNPLTTIRSTVQYLGQGLQADDPRCELVAELLQEVDRINATIVELLNLSRPADSESELLDLPKLVESCLRLMEPEILQRGLTLERRTPDDPIYVSGSAGQLRQVFVNLLLNALHASPHGGRLTVTVGRSPTGPGLAPGRWAEVAIHNTGSWIDPETRQKIFRPYFTTKKDGTGLGLVICERIVHQHGGEIEVTSDRNTGTTAFVRLRAPRWDHGQDPDHR